MGYETGQAGARDNQLLKEAIAEAVLDWFGDGGDFAVHCDATTADAVATDALARLKSKTNKPCSNTALQSDLEG
jgi:hypothetical protein